MSAITDTLHALLDNRQDEVNAWFREAYQQDQPFFYSSVDIRHSGYKMVPVDTNLFPAGFNLLTEEARQHAADAMKDYFLTYFPTAERVVLIPEDHTRNLYYLDNVAVLKSCLEKAGLEVRIAGLHTEEAQELTSAFGHDLTIEPLRRKGDTLHLDYGFTPDVILVNNDLSSGAPEILRNITQPVIPPVGMGWYRRRKTLHFDAYDRIAKHFANRFELDPWLISTVFTKCGKVNFKEKTGLECVAINVERSLQKIRQHYERYQIDDTPYVFIKADSGTYGMGVMTVTSPEEVLEINKKNRKKMSVIKEGVENSEVIIQEGVRTIDTVNGKPAEPLIYLINGTSIGCTYRVNEERDQYGNLNASGMTFHNACEKDTETAGDTRQALCPIQGLIARLATLAATKECYESNWEI